MNARRRDCGERNALGPGVRALTRIRGDEARMAWSHLSGGRRTSVQRHPNVPDGRGASARATGASAVAVGSEDEGFPGGRRATPIVAAPTGPSRTSIRTRNVRSRTTRSGRSLVTTASLGNSSASRNPSSVRSSWSARSSCSLAIRPALPPARTRTPRLQRRMPFTNERKSGCD